MPGPFDDIPITNAPGAAVRPAPGGGVFDDIPITRAPAAPTMWQRVRGVFTGEGRTEFPEAEEFHVAAQRAVQTQAARDPTPYWERVGQNLRNLIVPLRDQQQPPAQQEGGALDAATALGRASITPDPKAQLDILKRNIPGLESREDRFGNIMLRAPGIGVNEWTYLNRPGVSARDLEELGTQTVATLPFAGAVGLGSNLAARAGIGAAALGSASVAQDLAAMAQGSEQGVDVNRALVGAGLGTVAGPVAGWLAGRAANAPTPLMAQRAAEITEDISAHQRLGVRPFGPGFSEGPMASVAKQLAETPVIGGPVRRALEESIDETARSARNIAGQFGASATADEAGLVARQGLERFRESAADVAGAATRIAQQRAIAAPTTVEAQRNLVISAPVAESSLRTKQAALYDRAWSRIPPDMQQGRSVQGAPRVVGGMTETRNVLNEIAARNTRMVNAQGGAVDAGTRRTLPGGFLGDVIDAIRNQHWRAALQTMRDIRSDFRRLQSGIAQSEGAVLRHSDIDRIESAITRDMIALLERNADEYARIGQPQVAANMRRAIVDFRRADRFTRTAMERMETIERLFNADSATALYRNIAQAALSGTRGDVNRLRVLARTLRREEMDEIASYTLRAMGEPVPSARGIVQEVGFSPSSFMTRLNRMEPEARELIFGRAHAQALNDLGRVVNRIANVEALTNVSRSGTNALNLGGLLAGGGALATGQWESALGVLASGALASVLFSRPSYVRWVQGYALLRAAAAQAPQQMGPALTAHVSRLGAMASQDPRLLPVYRALLPVKPEDESPPGNQQRAQ